MLACRSALAGGGAGCPTGQGREQAQPTPEPASGGLYGKVEGGQGAQAATAARRRLQPLQEIHRPLRMRGRCEDRPLVALQHLQPMRQVGRMVGPHHRRHAQLRAQERRTQLRHQFLEGVVPEQCVMH